MRVVFALCLVFLPTLALSGRTLGRQRSIRAHATPAKPPQVNATKATPKVKSAPPTPVAQVAANSKATAATTKAGEAAHAAALAQAVKSLFASLLVKGPESYKEEFEPRCLDHVHALVARVDQSYTDVQLESNLLHQCEMEKEFPHSYEHGFNSHEACREFAKKLTRARMHELETGSDKGYREFCHDFYEHVYPPKKAKKTEKAGSTRSAVSMMTMIALGATYFW